MIDHWYAEPGLVPAGRRVNDAVASLRADARTRQGRLHRPQRPARVVDAGDRYPDAAGGVGPAVAGAAGIGGGRWPGRAPDAPTTSGSGPTCWRDRELPGRGARRGGVPHRFRLRPPRGPLRRRHRGRAAAPTSGSPSPGRRRSTTTPGSATSWPTWSSARSGRRRARPCPAARRRPMTPERAIGGTVAVVGGGIAGLSRGLGADRRRAPASRWSSSRPAGRWGGSCGPVRSPAGAVDLGPTPSGPAARGAWSCAGSSGSATTWWLPGRAGLRLGPGDGSAASRPGWPSACPPGSAPWPGRGSAPPPGSVTRRPRPACRGPRSAPPRPSADGADRAVAEITRRRLGRRGDDQAGRPAHRRDPRRSVATL